MKRIILAATAALILALAAPIGAQATPQPAKKCKQKKAKCKPKRPQRAAEPVQLVPHTIMVPGDLTAICAEGYCPGFSVFTATATATCPPGYEVVGGGWEAPDGPRGASVLENHAVSNRWLVTMEAAPFEPPRSEYRIGHFRAVASCTILLPA